MAARDKERYYWLKFEKCFFKRHDITVIESMDNGKDYVLFYLKLMLESVDHEGSLRFSDAIPYNERMLASITHTNVDIVKSALAILEELGMVQVLDDKTLYMTEVAKLLDSETYAAGRKREQRGRLSTGDNVPLLSAECPLEKDIDIDKELDKDKESNKRSKRRSRTPNPPKSADEVIAYCQERGNGIDGQYFFDLYESQKWYKVNGAPILDWKATVRTWERNKNNGAAKSVSSNSKNGADESAKRWNIKYD